MCTSQKVHGETSSSDFWLAFATTLEDMFAGSPFAWSRTFLWRSALHLLLVHRIHVLKISSHLVYTDFLQLSNSPLHVWELRSGYT